MKDRYKTVILGRDCEVCGYNDEGMLILGNGERFEITPLGVEPKTFRSYTLRAVSRLTFTGGQWLVDEVPLESYCARQFASPRTSESDTRVFTAWTLRDVLAEDRRESLSNEYPLPLELRRKATAIAWVEERFEDYPGQTRDPNEKPLRAEFQGEIIDMVTAESPPAKAFQPIFLSSFYRIQNSGETGLESAGPTQIPRAVEESVPGNFTYDVFLSHSSKDKAVVRPLAERLREDGLKVWFDEWVLKPGDSIPAKIEEGLEHSRVLVLCMSANAFGSDWAQLEAGTFRFRDPLNQERRFIPLRLDDAPIKGSLAQFLYINWLPADREQEYAKLLEACRSLVKPVIPVRPPMEGGLSTVEKPNREPLNATDDYVHRRRDTIQQVFSAFESIHAFFFKVCIDYLSFVEVLHAGLKATDADRTKYYEYVNEIGQKLHEMHLLEGRLAVTGADGAVRIRWAV